MKKGKDLENLVEVGEFWAFYLEKLGEMPEMDVAGGMVNIVTNDRWDDWYNESKGDPLFVETFDLVADLETPIKRELSREEMWRKVKKNVTALRQKYPK
jgi:hypothetical protein